MPSAIRAAGHPMLNGKEAGVFPKFFKFNCVACCPLQLLIKPKKILTPLSFTTLATLVAEPILATLTTLTTLATLLPLPFLFSSEPPVPS